jgi:hypothetical protein
MTAWNCDGDLEPKDYDHTVAMSMTKGECIRETGRQSFMPGKKDTKTGNICFIWYEDGDGNCERIQGARMMHFRKNPALVNCEAANVTGHTSYHFEWARPNDRNGEKVSLNDLPRVLLILEPVPLERIVC